jgi:hypothetical protein
MKQKNLTCVQSWLILGGGAMMLTKRSHAWALVCARFLSPQVFAANLVRIFGQATGAA